MLENPLNRWMSENGVSLRVMQGRLRRQTGIEVGYELVRRWSLPFDHQYFRMPGRAQMRAIYIVTRGAVRPDYFYDLPDIPGDNGGPGC